MTTSHQPVDEIDDIIELTDIIEEGTLPAPHAASPEKAVDAKSLDDELDALLSNAAPLEIRDDDITDDLDTLFATDTNKSSPAPLSSHDISPADSAQPASGSGVDLSELDELFDALKTSSEDIAEDNALDALLLGDEPDVTESATHGAQPTDTFSDADAVHKVADLPDADPNLGIDDLDMSLNLSGLEGLAEPEQAVSPAHHLQEADTPEQTVLPETPEPAPILHDTRITPAAAMLIEDLGSDLDLPGLVETQTATDMPTDQSAQPILEPDTPPALAQAEQVLEAPAPMSVLPQELESLATRVEALEAWKDQPPAYATPEDLASLRDELGTTLTRLESLEARPVLNAEEVSANLTETLTSTLTANLTAQQDAALDILRHDSASLAERIDQAYDLPRATPEDLASLRDELGTALARLESLEARPVVNTEELRASLMTTLSSTLSANLTAQQDAALDILRHDSASLAERIDQAYDLPRATPEDLASLRDELGTALARLESLEARPVVNTEELRASLMTTLSSTLSANLTAQQDAALDILRHDSSSLAERIDQAYDLPRATPEDLASLRDELGTALARLESLEARPVVNVEELSASVHASLDAALARIAVLESHPLVPQSQVTALSHGLTSLTARVEQAETAPRVAPQELTHLREDIRALGEQLGTTAHAVSSLTPLHTTTRELESDVATLRKVLQRQEAEIMSLREALGAKDTRIDALQATVQEMYATLKNFHAQQPSLTVLREELQAFVRQHIPVVAASIIREEIAELLQEMDEE
ncbi:hypothetical protein MASR1M90_02370 [Desulfovibrionales bacterium]